MILIYALQWPNSIKFHICFLFGRDFLLYEQFFLMLTHDMCLSLKSVPNLSIL